MENYMNGLQRYLLLNGLSVTPLAVQIADPSPQIDKQIEAICIKGGFPKRKFMGSEQGELASSQDDGSANDRYRERQRNYLTPRPIIGLVDRMVQVGVRPRCRATRPTR
jgi:hypothetical protein